MKQFICSLLLAAGLWPGLATAQVVGVSIPDTTVSLGADLWLPVRADSSLTGRNVTSFQFQFSFDPAMVEPDSVIQTGGLLDGAGWNVTLHRPLTGVVRVAAAGTTPLAGIGPIFRLRLKLLQNGSLNFTFLDAASNLLNEGDPPVVLDNGWIQIHQPPSIDVWPDDGVLAIGEQLAFSAGSSAVPLIWSVSDSTVASIDGNGLLTAISRGSVQISVRDTMGLVGRTDRSVVVRAIGISVPDTSIPATWSIDVPVRVTSLTPWAVTAGSIRLTYNPDALTPVSVLTAGTLLDGVTPTVNVSTAGAVRLSFATSQPVTGQGTLFIVRFQAKSTSGWSNLEFAEAIFNEDLPPKVRNGYVSVTSLTTISLNASDNKLLAEDTLAFSVWGGEAPYVWSSSDTLVARVDADGRLIGLRSGRVHVTVRDAQGAMGQSNEIQVFDGALKVEDRLAASPGSVDVPIRLMRLAAGHAVSSYQLTLTYDPGALMFDSVMTAGTATGAWATTFHSTGSSVTVAGATSGSLTDTGVVCIVRFAMLPGIPIRSHSNVSLGQAILNEGFPFVDLRHGSVLVAEPPGVVGLWSPGNEWTDRAVQLDLIWGSVEFAQQYELRLGTDSTFGTTVLHESTLVATTISVGPLQHGTVYFWQVRARNTLGAGPWSDRWTFRTIVAVPSAPTLAGPPSGSSDISTTPTLAWHPVAQASTYDLQVSSDSTFVSDVRLMAMLTDTSHSVGMLEHATTYYWRVRASNEAGSGDWSSFWSLTTVGLPAGPPEVPVLASPANGASGITLTPLLQWERSTNAQTYNVQVAEDAGFTNVVVNSNAIPDTSFSIGPLQPLRTYYWRVRAMNETDTSLYSGEWQFTTTTSDGVVSDRGVVPDRFGLEPNYPNPFNPSTRLRFLLTESSPVTLSIYTLTGVEVERLVEEELPAGTYETWWNADNMPTGVYLCRLVAGRSSAVQRLVLIK
jgi:hypothetical protein